jgi:hypothetical protein
LSLSDRRHLCVVLHPQGLMSERVSMFSPGVKLFWRNLAAPSGVALIVTCYRLKGAASCLRSGTAQVQQAAASDDAGEICVYEYVYGQGETPPIAYSYTHSYAPISHLLFTPHALAGRQC